MKWWSKTIVALWFCVYASFPQVSEARVKGTRRQLGEKSSSNSINDVSNKKAKSSSSKSTNKLSRNDMSSSSSSRKSKKNMSSSRSKKDSSKDDESHVKESQDITATTDAPPPKEIDGIMIRSLLREYVSSLNDKEKEYGYFSDANKQQEMWNACTIVQQCLDPDFMLSMALMPRNSRGLAYKILSKIMSQESYNLLLLQNLSNMNLGEMQDWATSCNGTCQELNNPNGQLLSELGTNPSTTLTVDYDECAKLRNATKPNETRYTFWYCNDEPRMIIHGDMDTITGHYQLGNIFEEPHIHGRNARYDYFAVYGNVLADNEDNIGPFGIRFSGHHLDLNYQFDTNGNLITDLPVFLGHNPLIVPSPPPPLTRAYNERALEDDHHEYLMWENTAGIAQFAEGVQIVLDCANELQNQNGSYVPLENFISVSRFGALDFGNNMTINNFTYMDLTTSSDEEFDHIWRLIEYTLKFSRGNRPATTERNLFRQSGKAVWTTTAPPEDGLPLSEADMIGELNFFYVRVETDDWVFFCMVNQMFTVMSETQATNHLHSILVERKLLTCEHSMCPT